MWFADVLLYVDDPDAVAEKRAVHRAYMADLLARGKLAAAGPFADLTGALFIYEAASATEAEQLAAQDPYTLAGLIREHTIRAWQLVYSDPSLLVQPPG